MTDSETRTRTQLVLADRKLDRFNRESDLWYWLAHARKEWAHGTYDQCLRDLERIDKLLRAANIK